MSEDCSAILHVLKPARENADFYPAFSLCTLGEETHQGLIWRGKVQPLRTKENLEQLLDEINYVFTRSIDRNDECGCRCRKKYKKCHQLHDESNAGLSSQKITH